MTALVLPVLRLRSHLAALLVVAMLLTFVLVLAGLLAYRVPRIERDSQRVQEDEVLAMRERMESLLQTRRTRLELLQALMAQDPASADAMLDSGAGDGSILQVISRLSPQGRVIAVGLPPRQRMQRADLLGNDLSADPLFKALGARTGAAWSGQYVSLLSGEPVAGVAIRAADGDVLLAEMPLAALMGAMQLAAGAAPSPIWVVDKVGEIIADSQAGRSVGKLNIRQWPLMQSLLQGAAPALRFHFEGVSQHATVSHSPLLGWYFIGHTPAGLANPQVHDLVMSVLATLAGSLGIGLLIAPFWARRMARPLDRIIARADRSASAPDDG